jgi:hypothetical protein
MSDLYVFTLFETDGGRPRCTGVMAGNKLQIYELYRPGARKTIETIETHLHLIRDLFLAAHQRGIRVITSDFRSHIQSFGLPTDQRVWNVHDVHYPHFPPGSNAQEDAELLRKIFDKLIHAKVKDYQKVMANAACVYHDLQNRGLIVDYTPERPLWSKTAFSGRSRCRGFNIQGFTEAAKVLPPGADERSVLLHFDWICADIRAASLLSGDRSLQQSFVDSDPYTYMMNIINADARTPITRDECKKILLSAINSMAVDSVVLAKIYPVLGDWIVRCRNALNGPGGYMETLLGRRFRVAHIKQGRSKLSVLNGAMQGSVAHAMESSIRKVWEKIGNRVVADIYDSLIVCSPPSSSEIKATIDTVTGIMLRPFCGLLPDNPVFPLKVSMGLKWKKWRLLSIHRENGVHRAKGEPTEEESTSAEGEPEEVGSPEEADGAPEGVGGPSEAA